VIAYGRVMGWQPLPGNGPEPSSLGSGLDAVVRRLGGRSATTMVRVVEHWSEIIGADLAPVTTPVRIDQGCLTVATIDSVYTTEIRFREGQIRERIGAMTDDGGVVRVRVTIVARR